VYGKEIYDSGECMTTGSWTTGSWTWTTGGSWTTGTWTWTTGSLIEVGVEGSENSIYIDRRSIQCF
jgi:hypothetical protein